MSAKKQPRNGKLVSRPAKRPLQIDFKQPGPKLIRLLQSTYNRYQRLDDPTVNAKVRQDFVFHMTDWIDDLERLSDVYKQPDKMDRKTAEEVVAGFLIHVISHLMEAGRLLLDYEPGFIFDSPKPKAVDQRLVKPAVARKRRSPSPARR